MPIGDEHGGEAIVRQLRPQVVMTPIQHRVRTVAEVRGKGRTGVDRRLDLGGVGGSMAKRDGDAGLHEMADISRRLWPVRRKGNQFHEPAGGHLPSVELGDGRRADVGRRVRAPRGPSSGAMCGPST